MVAPLEVVVVGLTVGTAIGLDNMRASAAIGVLARPAVRRRWLIGLLVSPPLFIHVVAIVVPLGLSALLSQQFDLSIFLVNMLTGMGLALGIDYSLFVVSRYREERGRGRTEPDPSAAGGGPGATTNRP